MKCASCEIVDLPFIVVMVNHLKQKVEMTGGHAVQKDHNPGGSAIRFHATIALRCHAVARPKSSQTGSYQDILITCAKNSVGETWKQLKVRKYCRRDQEGNSFFWWDWPRATVEFLAGFGPKHPIRDVVDLEKSGEDGSRVTCRQLGVKLEDISQVGETIHSDLPLMAKVLEVLPYQNYKEFLRLTDDEYTKLLEEARVQKAKALAEMAAKKAEEGEGKP